MALERADQSRSVGRDQSVGRVGVPKVGGSGRWTARSDLVLAINRINANIFVKFGVRDLLIMKPTILNLMWNVCSFVPNSLFYPAVNI